MREQGDEEDGLEVYCRGDRYVLLEMAPATGNRLLRFSSGDKGLVYAALAGELGGTSER